MRENSLRKMKSVKGIYTNFECLCIECQMIYIVFSLCYKTALAYNIAV